MRTLTLVADVPAPADAAYARLSDFSSYPRHSPAVRDVAVTDVESGIAISRWEVAFRNGVLRWTEQDVFDPALRRIAFTQLEGDIDVFRGSWQCAPAGDACRVTFSAELDLGIPTLADALEPIAVRALAENTVSILTGLFGSAVVVPPAARIPAQGPR